MTYSIKAPAKYVQGCGELANLGRNAKKLGQKFFILCSENNRKRIGTVISESLKNVDKDFLFENFHGECTKAEIERIMSVFEREGCDVMLGAGGGKAIDTAKAVAENLGGKPLVIVPTVASNDAPCSGVAVIYNEAGAVVKALITRRNPDLVLVDTGIIAKTPKRLLAAGIGDGLATWFETRAAYRSNATSMARGKCTNTARMMSKLCYDILLADSEDALQALETGEVNQALENVVEACIYLSGIGFESGGLAVAHALHDGLAQLPAAHGAYHGEKVAFGLLTQLVLEGKPQPDFDHVLHLIQAAGLPSTLSELGLDATDKESLLQAAGVAAQPKQFGKNLRSDITAEEIYHAMLEADRVGRLKK